jgi:hypothetical protein
MRAEKVSFGRRSTGASNANVDAISGGPANPPASGRTVLLVAAALVFLVGLVAGHLALTPVKKDDGATVTPTVEASASASALMLGTWVVQGTPCDASSYMSFRDTSIDGFVDGDRIKSIPISGYRFVDNRLMIVTAAAERDGFTVAFGIYVMKRGRDGPRDRRPHLA